MADRLSDQLKRLIADHRSMQSVIFDAWDFRTDRKAARKKLADYLVNNRDNIAAIIDAAVCRRFTTQWCMNRPELPEDEWCAVCRALAAFGAGQETDR